MRARIEALLTDRAAWQAAGQRALRAFERRHAVPSSVAVYERVIEGLLAERRALRLGAEEIA
jgi:hypothetical protein